MAQQYKIDKVAELKELFDSKSEYVFSDYRGLSVEKMTDLRRRLKKLDSKFVVIKNSYINIIAKNNNMPELNDNTKGPTAVTFSDSDNISEAIKTLFDFSKGTTLKVKGGWIDGIVYDAKGIEVISKLPGKPQMIAMLMATMNAPLQNFVYSCNDVIGRFVRAVNAVAEQKKGA
ncbi:MAG TPA: 50S ribosomal protein L10 [Spirochaetota bacterium]|nr:MAG: 50S ribosomal protein L10 [Spirochaetes bacterium ADurb.Bin133]HNZ26214.1 50S ribosomal protein L10 [Spirochaetota bacterium]HOS33618.1 50S ribosomal protein L10 [Spirochaetota bacterium]HOS55077.1 50S ribosomal protein L10 [Spirochaetota bacterium]HPK61234.1 50S ribosomal protein L10 [Spirochaetota bacterium]